VNKLFEDIKIIDIKSGILKPIHTIGWKFTYKKNEYGDYISDQVGTGKYCKYWDEDEGCECEREIMKTVPITPKKEIALMENMVEAMKKIAKVK